MLKLVLLDSSTISRFTANESELVGIWPEEVSNDIRESTYECVNQENEPVFLIELNGSVVGITGWFIDDQQVIGLLCLRWTGLLKEYRLQGLGSKVLDLLKEEAVKRIPYSTGFIEFVLDEKFMPDVRPFFIKYGFVKQYGKLTAGYVWEPYVYRWYK